MRKAEQLIIEFHKITQQIKQTNLNYFGQCEEVTESHYQNCITIAYEEAKADKYEYGVDLDCVCGVCKKVLDNAANRSKLKIKRGYVKNSMHALAKKLMLNS